MQQRTRSRASCKPSRSWKTRGRGACLHRLDELLLVALCAITSGADSWVTVGEWGRMKLDWLRRWLPFANGIASHDTFSRVFSLLDA